MQPSTRAASTGSLGMASRPARIRIAKTEVDDQISAIEDGDEGEMALDQPGDRAVGQAERLQRVVHQADIVVEHELELEADEDRREHHREHHHRAQHALAARRLLDQQGQAETEQHFEVERDGQQQHGAAEGDPEIPVGEDLT